MAQAIGFISAALDVVSIITVAASFFSQASEENKFKTNVRIGISDVGTNADGREVKDVNQGGSVPHIALWNEQGGRIGQFKGDENGHLGIGDFRDFPIEHTQTDPPNSDDDAAYLMLTMMETDAICIAYISMTTAQGVNFMFFGDIAAQCDAPWYYSARAVDNLGYTPKCMWLDKDHTNHIRHAGVGIHMPDMVATEARVQQYHDNRDSLCKSTPRFQMYSEISPDQFHPIFEPPLLYNEDRTDKDLDKVINNKGVAKGSTPSLKKRNLWRRDVSGNGTLSNYPLTNSTSGNNTLTADKLQLNATVSIGRNNDPSKIVISAVKNHSARELCGSKGSTGPDLFSQVENLLCDMSTKELWPKCDEEVKDSCFDLETETMRGPASGIGRRDERSGREVPEKHYSKHLMWGQD